MSSICSGEQCFLAWQSLQGCKRCIHMSQYSTHTCAKIIRWKLVAFASQHTTPRFIERSWMLSQTYEKCAIEVVIQQIQFSNNYLLRSEICERGSRSYEATN